MTTLFISHGAPTLAMEPGKTGEMLHQLGLSLPRPRAILVISAHWDTPEPRVSFAQQPETLHDFSGFPKAMYDMHYPAPGCPELAEKVVELLMVAQFNIQRDPKRGLDHGAWVPLMLMYPDADIPVTQLSIQGHRDPASHYRMGQALASLQDSGVMLLCSGAITHNLRHLFEVQRTTSSLAYVTEFANWVGDRIVDKDDEALLNYRKQSINGVLAHPEEDHILPLFVALGAARGPAVRYQPEHTYGFLAMDAYAWTA